MMGERDTGGSVALQLETAAPRRGDGEGAAAGERRNFQLNDQTGAADLQVRD